MEKTSKTKDLLQNDKKIVFVMALFSAFKINRYVPFKNHFKVIPSLNFGYNKKAIPFPSNFFKRSGFSCIWLD